MTNNLTMVKHGVPALENDDDASIRQWRSLTLLWKEGLQYKDQEEPTQNEKTRYAALLALYGGQIVREICMSVKQADRNTIDKVINLVSDTIMPAEITESLRSLRSQYSTSNDRDYTILPATVEDTVEQHY
jgi:hypothetical protein